MTTYVKMIPVELINIILSYRPKHKLAEIFSQEYINIFNKKKYGNIVSEIIHDLTSGINRNNGFGANDDETIGTDYETIDTDDETIDTDDEEQHLNINGTNAVETYFSDNDSDIDYEYMSEMGYDDFISVNQENTEHWALSNRDNTVQLQGINCRCCGNYLIQLDYMKDNIMCHCF